MNESILANMERPKMVFEKTHQNAQLPKKAHSDDAGWDVFAIEDQVVEAKSSAIVKIGLKLAFLEEGYWIKFESRSGMAFNHDVVAFQGVVDNCVPKGTKIYTKNGDINVEDLIEHSEENHIYSFNEESHDLENDRIKPIHNIRIGNDKSWFKLYSKNLSKEDMDNIKNKHGAASK